MAPFQGQLWLGKVSQLDDDVASELAKRSGGAYLDGVQEYHDGPGHLELARALTNDDTLFLRGLKQISPGALQVFAEFNGKFLLANPMIDKKISALRIKKVKGCTFIEPEEWNSGRIVPLQRPANPLKGRNAQRTVAERASWWLPKKVCRWFVQKLDDAHKTVVSGSGKYISYEAEKLLREKADSWLWLMESEVKGAKENEASSIKSLATIKSPKQFKEGQVSLPVPRMPVAKAYCWKPDFEGEDYQSVLHYYSYLPTEHVGSITDSKGYPAKSMSPEAADLYRLHRPFWEAKLAESKALSRAALKSQKKAVEQRMDKSAEAAGLSREELETKLERLSNLVEQGDLNLVADMIAGFGVPWLYEALLAGACITAEGDLKPGKVLKRFKKNDKIVMLLTLAFMPEGGAVDHSLHRNSMIRIDVEQKETLELLEKHVFQNLPNLKLGRVSLSLKHLSKESAEFLSKCSGVLSLTITQMTDAVALALSAHEGWLLLSGFQTITDVAAEALSRHRGDISIGVYELTEHKASLMANYC
jgi:hypothetical protein